MRATSLASDRILYAFAFPCGRISDPFFRSKTRVEAGLRIGGSKHREIKQQRGKGYVDLREWRFRGGNRSPLKAKEGTLNLFASFPRLFALCTQFKAFS